MVMISRMVSRPKIRVMENSKMRMVPRFRPQVSVSGAAMRPTLVIIR